jgi:hypothetical protein
VAFKNVDDFMEEALLSVPDLSIRKHVAKAIRNDFSSGMNGNSPSVLPGLDQPLRGPIEAAQVPAKEGGKDLEVLIVGGIRNLNETVKNPDGNRMDFRLEIFPHQKNPGRLEPIFGQERKVSFQIGGLEHPPQVDPGFRRPVIYADGKSFRIFQIQSPHLEVFTIISQIHGEYKLISFII